MTFRSKTKRILRKQGGFSFIELIVVIVGVGILSYIALAKFSGSSDAVKEKTFARKVISDIRYAQEMALNYRQTVQVLVEPDQNRYSLRWGGGNYLQTPVAFADFIVDTDDGYYSGVSITSSGFSAGLLEFSPAALPMNGGAALGVETTLMVINNQITIKISPGSGRSYIEE